MNTHVSSPGRLVADSEEKFNVVIYGISECPKDTPRSERLTQDLSKVGSVLSKVSSSIQSQAIQDCYHLGKFNPQNTKPRPILVKLIRIADMHYILSNRGLLSSPTIIKPDMTAEGRHRESVLLKERWNLIQSGIPKNVIKIQGPHLYVRKRLHGQYKNSTFVSSTTSQPSPVPCPKEHSSTNAVSHTSSPLTFDTPPNSSDTNSKAQPISPSSIVTVTTPSTLHAPHSTSCRLSNTGAQPPLSPTIVSISNKSTSTSTADTNLDIQSTD